VVQGAGRFGTRPLRVVALALSILGSLLLGQAPPALGQQYWDGATTTGDGTVHGGTGTWDNSTTNWTNSGGTSNSAWSGGFGIFAGSAGTVTASAAVSYSFLEFTTSGYVVSATGGGTLTPSGLGAIAVGSGQTATISAAITGTGGLEATGPGTLVLSGVNTYTNVTQIDSSATLALKGNGSIANSLYVAFFSCGCGLATFDISQTNAGTSVTGLYDPAGVGIVALGSKTLTVTGNNGLPFNGVIQDGGIGVGSGGAVTIASGAWQQLGGVNTYTGATTINATGELDLTGTGSIATSSGVTANGIFDISLLTTSGASITTLSGSGTVALGSETLALTKAAGTFSGVIQDSGQNFGATGGMLVLSAGTETLTGANTYTGGTILSGGTLVVGNNSALGTGTLAMAAGTTLSFLNTANFTIANPITIAGDPNFTPPSGTTQTLSGTISDGSSPGVVGMTSAGTLVLSGANTYSGGTVISSGVLQVTNNSSVGTGTVTLGGGMFQAGATPLSFSNAFAINTTGGTIDTQTNTLTLSGAIGNGNGTTGPLNKIGTGTLILSGTSSYTGATNVNAGILQAGATNVFAPASAFTVASGATLNLNSFNETIGSLAGAGSGTLGSGTLTLSNASGTFSGIISGAGGSLVQTAGVETLTGANTYSGGTRLNDGTLVVGNNNALGTGMLAMAAGTTLSFLSTSNITLANNISVSGDPVFTPPSGTTQTLLGTISDGGSPGVVSMNGAGTLVLSGANTYSGGTVISSGALQVTNKSSVGTGTVTLDGGTFQIGATPLSFVNTFAINSAGGTIDTQASTLTLSGPIGNGDGTTGALNKIGNGTLFLSGTESYAGPTNVNSGKLDVTGSIAASSLTSVASGATLTGTGMVGKTQISSGAVFAPGSGTPGTSMKVAGNLAFASGALYVVQLSPSTTTMASVSGSATLTGATVSAQFASGSYVPKQYTILTAAGKAGGTTFAGLTNTNLPAGLVDTLSYSTNNVYLNLEPGFTQFTRLSTNQQSVVATLGNYFDATSGLPVSFATLSAGELTQLSGEVAADSRIVAFQLMDQFLNLMLDPFVDGRLGSGAGSISGRAMGFAPDEGASLPPEIALAYAGVLKAPLPAPFEQRWTTWGASYGGGNWTDGNAAVGSSNVAAQTYGVAAGMDYHYSPDTIFGFALGGGGTNWGLATGGTGRSDAFQTGVYGITRSGPAYLAGALAFANHWMTTSRSAVGDGLTSSFDAQSYGARVESGYRFAALPALGVTPYAALQAQDFRTPSYSETDVTGGGFGLSYAAMNATDVRSELGARFDNPEVIGGMPLLLRARVAWAHDWVSNPSLSAAFESLPGANFTVNGAPLPQNSALTSAGAELFITPRVTVLVKFDGEFAPGSQTYAGSGTLRYIW
jgi:autotransporter-associated beta strand protein